MRNSKKYLANIFLFSIALAACSPQGGGETELAGGEVLPFIIDDYASALSTAQEKNIPLFIDAWAPW